MTSMIQLSSPSPKSGPLRPKPKKPKNVIFRLFAILVLAGVAALMGIWRRQSGPTRITARRMRREGILVNTIGILIILFISGVTFLVSKFSKEDPKASVH